MSDDELARAYQRNVNAVAEYTMECAAAIDSIGGDPATVRELVRVLRPFCEEGIEDACDECGGGPCIGCPVSAARAVLAKIPEAK